MLLPPEDEEVFVEASSAVMGSSLPTLLVELELELELELDRDLVDEYAGVMIGVKVGILTDVSLNNPTMGPGPEPGF